MFNVIEELEGLWDSGDLRYTGGVYCGVRLTLPLHSNTAGSSLLTNLYPRVQIAFRRSTQESHDPETDLYQWYRGSKLCSGALEGIIIVSNSSVHGNYIEVKVRSPSQLRTAAFYFMEDLITVIQQVHTPIKKYR